MFDVFGLVSDTASQYLDENESLFQLPQRAVLDSGAEFGGCYNDVVSVGQTRVTLDQDFYSLIHLGDGDMELRPFDFVREFMVPAIRGVAQIFHEFVEDNPEVIVTRALAIPKYRPVHGGGYIDANGIQLRWIIDYSSQYLADRLVVDVIAGKAQEMTQPDRPAPRRGQL